MQADAARLTRIRYHPPPMHRLTCALALLLACTPKEPEADDGSTGPASTSTTTPTDAAPTDAAGSSDEGTIGDCEQCPENKVGYVCVTLHRGEGVGFDPFPATGQILLTLHYEQCLTDYYTIKRPEMAMGEGGPGDLVFAAWKDRLCTADVDQPVPCTVEFINQNLTPGFNTLTVIYTITDPTQIDGHTLAWGPIPLPEFAGCDDGVEPFVKLQSVDDVLGRDPGGDPLWHAQSFANTRVVGSADPGECLQVNIVPE